MKMDDFILKKRHRGLALRGSAGTMSAYVPTLDRSTDWSRAQ